MTIEQELARYKQDHRASSTVSSPEADRVASKEEPEPSKTEENGNDERMTDSEQPAKLEKNDANPDPDSNVGSDPQSSPVKQLEEVKDTEDDVEW